MRQQRKVKETEQEACFRPPAPDVPVNAVKNKEQLY